MATKGQEEEIKIQLQKRLRRPVNPEILGYLQEKYYVSEVLQGVSSIGDLLKEYRRLEKLANNTSRRLTSKEGVTSVTGETGQAVTLSVLLATQIGQLPEVKRFRREVLGDRLIPLEDVKEWVQAARRKDGPHTIYAEVPVASIVFDRQKWPQKIVEESNLRCIGYRIVILEFVSSSEHVEKVTINAHGVLGRLKHLAENIVLYHAPSWREDLAVSFILTGLTPIVPKVRYKTTMSLYGGPCWVTMSFDARITPEELARQYRKIRRELMGKNRAKPLSKKIQSVARFAAEHKTGERTWREIMELWNKQYPGWIYKDYKRFCRDATRATRAILSPGIDYDSMFSCFGPGKPGGA